MKKSDQIKAIGTVQVEESGQASGRHALWLAILAPLAALAMGLIAFSAFASTPLSIAGYADFEYGSTIQAEPTANMGQSKVWWNDGSWWGVLYNMAAGEYRIYRLNAETQEWIDTGVAVDDREESRSDVLWDEATQKLYVASHIKRENPSPPVTGAENWARLYRFSYDANTDSYSLDQDFPAAELNNYRTESLTIDKDSTGRLWAAWVARVTDGVYGVFVSYTQGDDLNWSSAYQLPFSTQAIVDVDDIAALIAFNDDEGPKVGVVWSNQEATNRRFYFATHLDSSAPESDWTLDANFTTAVNLLADDHINLAKTDSGQLFMALKTGIDPSNSENDDETLIALVTRETDGTTSVIEVAPGSSRDTRPIVVVNESTDEVYVFTVNKSGGEAVCRFTAEIRSPLSDIYFPASNCSPPEGEPPDSPARLAALVDAEIFIADSTTYLLTNNPSSTKQRVNSESGVLVLASDEHTKYYVHNLKDNAAPDPEETPTATVEPAVTGTIEPTATGTAEPTPTGTSEPGPTVTVTGEPGPTATGTVPPPTPTSVPVDEADLYLPYFVNP